MGRPPIGEWAMTPAEKKRRYRARKFGNKRPFTKSHAAVAARDARIRELEAQLVHERTRIKMLVLTHPGQTRRSMRVGFTSPRYPFGR
jgi:hypothetical protein